ncbi:MAG: hypothetical protein NTX53_02745 [candidate division WOR-3 bacterium]|nr:hypothetical protein [candidate division WOR-3 bacterium]
MHRLCPILAGLLMAAVLLFLTGCGGPGGRGQTGNMSADLSGLPKTLRYPYAQTVSAGDGTYDGEPATVYSFTTNDPIPPVTQYYRAQLAKWKDYPVSASASGSASGFTSPDGKRTVVITVEPGEAGKTNLTIYNITK